MSVTTVVFAGSSRSTPLFDTLTRTNEMTIVEIVTSQYGDEERARSSPRELKFACSVKGFPVMTAQAGVSQSLARLGYGVARWSMGGRAWAVSAW